jgi:FkbM family methyltransferase
LIFVNSAKRFWPATRNILDLETQIARRDVPLMSAIENLRARLKRSIEPFLGRHPRLHLALANRLGNNLSRRVFVSLIRPGDAVLDIGANWGAYTTLFSNLAGIGGSVDAFEPLPAAFEILDRETRRSAPIRNWRLHRLACSDTAGVASIWVPGDDQAQASLRKHHGASWITADRAREHRIEQIRVDDFARPGDGRVDFVKIDVEGAELLVLRGMERTLRQRRPLVFFEHCPGWMKDFGYGPPDVFAEFRRAGYDSFWRVGPGVTRLKGTGEEWADGGGDGSCDVVAGVAELHVERIKMLETVRGNSG